MTPKCSWLIFLALAGASSLPAAEITGKVRDASGDAATVVIDGDALPAVGDSAEIFFKMPGADEEISVASGKVAAVEAKGVKIKIDEASGTIEKDQLVRIKPARSPTTAGASPSPASPSAVASPSAASTPSPDEALVSAAIQLYERDAVDGAMEALEKAIALNPKNARAYFHRGMCFHRKENRRAAIADFEKARELDPSLDWREITAEPTPARAGTTPKP